MPTYSTIGVVKQTDVQLGVSIVPPTNIAGWSLSYQIFYRFGGSGILIASSASGYTNGQSGITVSNPGNGQFSVTIPGAFSSGLTSDVYWGQACRTDSGLFTVLAETSINILP